MSARLAAIGTVCVAALAALYLGIAHHDAAGLRDANNAGAAGDYRGALDRVGKLHRAPVASRAQLTRARALFDLGRRAESSAAFELAVKSDPHNWIIHRDWAVVLVGLGRRAQATRELRRARSLNPRLQTPLAFLPAQPPAGR